MSIGMTAPAANFSEKGLRIFKTKLVDTLTLTSCSRKETIAIAQRLARYLGPGDCVGLIGELGAGKTTFVQGLAQGLGIRCPVRSPSFVILKAYKNKIPLFHFDLYRLSSLKDLEDIGYEDFMGDRGICVIEWADRAKMLLPWQHLEITIVYATGNKQGRSIYLKSCGLRYKSILGALRTKSKRWICT